MTQRRKDVLFIIAVVAFGVLFSYLMRNVPIPPCEMDPRLPQCFERPE